MNIDKNKVIQKTLELDVASNEEGLIPFFGVNVQRLPTEFWNSFARRIVNNVPEDLIEVAEGLLVNAARECAYHTAHGVIMSQDWTNIVSTMVRTVEEMMITPFMAFAAWGWGNCEVVELEPKKKMVVRAHDYYESDIITYGESSRPCAYMLQGLCAALMDLGYGKAYPNGIGTFNCVQTKGIELGDQFGEFLVTKA